MKRLILLTLVCVAGLAVAAGAQVPQALNYQGVLTDDLGQAVAEACR